MSGPRTRVSLACCNLLKELSVALRQDFYWTWVEQKKGERVVGAALAKLERLVIDAKKVGADPLLVLAYGNTFYTPKGFPITPESQDAFAMYAQSIAQHFKGVVRRYEVWNEWNIGLGTSPRSRGDPGIYAQLLSKVYPALKAVDPNIVVLGGSVAGLDEKWVNQFIQAGAASMMDGLAIHPYVSPDLPEKAIAGLDSIEEKLSRSVGGREIPIYATEIGWSNQESSAGVTPNLAADYLVRLYLLGATRSFIKGIWWYELWNGGSDPRNKEHNFGLYNMDRSPKPPACAMREIAKILAAYKPVRAEQRSDGMWVVHYSDGQQNLFAMTRSPGRKIDGKCDKRNER